MANTASKVVKVAEAEEGYLEKKTNKWLSFKTKNAGSNNYTKYGKWFGMNGVFWCAIFISWIFNKAFGKKKQRNYCVVDFPQVAKHLDNSLIKKEDISVVKKLQKKDILFFLKELGIREQTILELLQKLLMVKFIRWRVIPTVVRQ